MRGVSFSAKASRPYMKQMKFNLALAAWKRSIGETKIIK